MRRALLILLVITVIAGPVAAQDCGNGLPCGPIPWRLPQLPTLRTPTPFPTVQITANGYVPTPTGTLTPTPTGTLTAVPTTSPTPGGLDVAAFNQQIGTLQAVVNATEETLQNRAQGFDLAANATNIFGYVLGLQMIHFGVFTPLIQFAFFGVFFVIGIKVLFWLLPLLVTLVGMIRKAVQIVLDFIPG